MDIGALTPADRHVDSVVEMMLDATQNYAQPLTTARLFAWHAALFPTGYSGMTRIQVGTWRDDRTGPMQVVSGPIGKQRVHYQAPAAARLDQEMHAFLHGFNAPGTADPVIKAGLAHLWFVIIHPFDDGNGRIARAIADMALARSEQSPQRFYSMSSQIRRERNAYYDMLETAQQGDLDVTPWLRWFLACLDRAFDDARTILSAVLRKARFWDTWATAPLNARHALRALETGQAASARYAEHDGVRSRLICSAPWTIRHRPPWRQPSTSMGRRTMPSPPVITTPPDGIMHAPGHIAERNATSGPVTKRSRRWTTGSSRYSLAPPPRCTMCGIAGAIYRSNRPEHGPSMSARRFPDSVGLRANPDRRYPRFGSPAGAGGNPRSRARPAIWSAR
jgi:fido (protein-threonine AMPylation protein)